MPSRCPEKISGHRSDAIDSYQVTSHEQQKEFSNILAVKPSNITCREVTEFPNSSNNEKVDKEIDENSANGGNINVSPSQVMVKSGDVKQSTVDKSHNIGTLIDNIVNANQKKGKTVIKIEIEISHD